MSPKNARKFWVLFFLVVLLGDFAARKGPPPTPTNTVEETPHGVEIAD